MAIEKYVFFMTGDCPLCGAPIFLPQNIKESGIFACQKCQSMLVIDSCKGRTLYFSEAPQIEEDWGE